MRNGLLNQRGYSLIETMLVLGILGVITGIAVIQVGASKQALSGDGAMRVVVSQMNQAKQLAITQRRNMRVTFTNNNSMQIIREEVPGPTLTTISSVPFEGGLQFVRVTSAGHRRAAAPELPSPAPTPPSAGAIAFGATTTEMRFSPDGVFVDQDGATLNGTLFVAHPGQGVVGPCGHDFWLDRPRPRLPVGRQLLEGGVVMRFSSAKVSRSPETVVALGVLTTGVLGAAAVLATGMQNLASSPTDVVSTQKAAEAMEAVFSARQSGKLTWTQINNVSNGGVFLDGPQSLYRPGADGLVNTADDTAAGTQSRPSSCQARIRCSTPPTISSLRWAATRARFRFRTSPARTAAAIDHCDHQYKNGPTPARTR